MRAHVEKVDVLGWNKYLSKSDSEEPKYIFKYRSFVGQLMWYTTKVGYDVENMARELAVHMIHPGPEYRKALGHIIGYLKGKEKKGIFIRKPKVIKYVIFFDSNYTTYKDTRKSFSGLVSTLGGILLIC